MNCAFVRAGRLINRGMFHPQGKQAVPDHDSRLFSESARRLINRGIDGKCDLYAQMLSHSYIGAIPGR